MFPNQITKLCLFSNFFRPSETKGLQKRTLITFRNRMTDEFLKYVY